MNREEMPPATSSAEVTSKPRRRLSRRKLWLFRITTIVGALLILPFLEGLFRLCGVGENLRLVVAVEGTPEKNPYRLNPRADLAYYGVTDVSGPEPRRFELPKPAGTFRIVFLGASTVIGFPYDACVAFPRQVEVQLACQEPETQFEVLNAGVTSMNSFAVADLARQALAADPDLLVVHTGHNEFYGPGGPASQSLTLPPRWLASAYSMRRWRVSQMLHRITSTEQPVQRDLMERLPTSLAIPLQGPIVHQAEANLRANLEQILSLSESSGVPVLLSTVASNLRNQGPLNPIWPASTSLEAKPEFERRLASAEASLLRSEFDAALAELRAAEAICRDHARLAYRFGQCFDALGRPAEARAQYERARDLDGCRFRAPSSFREIVLELAQTHEPAIPILDVAGKLNHRFPNGPGYETFLEHVHYTFDGHALLGELFARHIQKIRRRSWNDSRMPGREELAQKLGLLEEDHVAAGSIAMFVLETEIQSAAVDSAYHRQHLAALLEHDFQSLSPERQRVFAEMQMNEMDADLAAHLARRHLAAGNLDLALQFAQAQVIREPWEPACARELAEIQKQRADTQAAEESRESAQALE